MLAYAPQPDRQRLSPTALTLIIAGHAAALALVITAKSADVFKTPITRTEVTFVEPPEVPPPEPQDQAVPQPSEPHITTVDPIVPPRPGPGPIADPLPQPLPQPGNTIGTGSQPIAIPHDPPLVRTGPHLATAAESLRPPYPDSKRETGDEASLRLTLTIDAGGRVVAVDPVGRVDKIFFDAARRHILRAWRYRPAMEGTKAVSSTTTITLRFELGNV